ncbi:unnamed protein product [marine sediment metagenome]|uniref:Uncharacterized protein n=1 Tax=marine sediment metagenome TaxID=412755 RepID=X0RYG4_9ZZZZ
MIISDDRLETALKYLASTDPKIGQLKANLEELEDHKKIKYAICYCDAVGDTVADRTQSSYTDQRYIDHIDEMATIRIQYEQLRAKRHTQEIIIEVWRTLQANQRRGNI